MLMKISFEMKQQSPEYGCGSRWLNGGEIKAATVTKGFREWNIEHTNHMDLQILWEKSRIQEKF